MERTALLTGSNMKSFPHANHDPNRTNTAKFCEVAIREIQFDVESRGSNRWKQSGQTKSRRLDGAGIGGGSRPGVKCAAREAHARIRWNIAHIVGDHLAIRAIVIGPVALGCGICADICRRRTVAAEMGQASKTRDQKRKSNRQPVFVT